MVFVWWVMRVPEPFLPISVLNNPVMRIGVVAASCTQGVSIGLTIYVPMYYELVHKLSASNSGLALIPIVMMTTPGSFTSGRAMLYMRHYKWVPIVMLIVTAIAVALLAMFPLMPVWAVAVVLCLVGLGTGSSYPVVTVSIQNALPHHQIGVAMGAMNFFRALASALVVAMMGAIMLAHLGAAPQRGAVATGSELVAVAANASSADLAHMFSIDLCGRGGISGAGGRRARPHGGAAAARLRGRAAGRAGAAGQAGGGGGVGYRHPLIPAEAGIAALRVPLSLARADLQLA